MKKNKIIYWIFTSLIFLLISLPAVFFNSAMNREVFAHLGFPYYFLVELELAKVIGGIVLILPVIPKKYKEWAYIGFGIDFISAFIANYVVDGWVQAIPALVAMVILVISYKYFHKIKDN